MSPHPLRIQLFGGLHIILPDHGNTVDLGPQAGALLARLALEPRRTFTREELIDFLWPDDELEEGRRKLRQLAYSVRHSLDEAGCAGTNLFLSTRATLQINQDAADVDTVEFRRSVRAARQSQAACDQVNHFEHAVEVYAGELLPGFYQDVFVAERSRCAEECYQAFRGLSRAREQLGDVDGATDAARRAIELNPTGEEAHCDLMRCHALKGELSAVVRQYRDMERILRQELDANPSPASRDLLARLRGAEANNDVSVPSPASPIIGQEFHVSPLVRAIPGKPVRPSYRRQRNGSPAYLIVMSVLLVALVSIFLFRLHAPFTPPPVTTPTAGYHKEPLWVTRYAKGPGDQDSEPQAIVTDQAGYSYVAGFINTARHDNDILVIKYDPQGKQVWEYRYNGPGNDVDRARCIALDKAGNIYVAGDSDNGKGADHWTRLSGEDFVVIKLGPDGQPSATWPNTGPGVGVRRYNGPDNGEEMPKNLLVDDSGGVYVLGYSYSRKGDRDWAVVKYDATGRQVWVQRYDSPDHDEDWPNDMVFSNDRCLYVTGWSRLRPHDSPEQDILTIKYRMADGKEEWTRRWGQDNHADDSGQFVFANQWGIVHVVGVGRTGPGTFNNTRSGYVTLTYDQAGKLHRARGALGESDQLDRVDVAWENGALGERDGFFYVVKRNEAGARSSVTRYALQGINNVFLAKAGGKYLYMAGAISAAGHETEPTDYVTLGITSAGDISREWFYRGTGNPAAPDAAKAVAVWDVDLGANNRQEYVIVTGQSASGKNRDIATLCYRSY